MRCYIEKVYKKFIIIKMNMNNNDNDNIIYIKVYC